MRELPSVSINLIESKPTHQSGISKAVLVQELQSHRLHGRILAAGPVNELLDTRCCVIGNAYDMRTSSRELPLH